MKNVNEMRFVNMFSEMYDELVEVFKKRDAERKRDQKALNNDVVVYRVVATSFSGLSMEQREVYTDEGIEQARKELKRKYPVSHIHVIQEG